MRIKNSRRRRMALEPLESRMLLRAAPVFSTVTLHSNFGDITMQMLDNDAPGTVDNFLGYVDNGDYNNAIFHRLAISVTPTGERIPFVLQGGGFTSSTPDLCSQANCTVGDVDASQFGEVFQGDTIQNEFGVSNTIGTVAMAKIGGNPDSATNQFFFNLNDNSSNLDNQNGGFTVFARVTDMTTLNAITGFDRINLASLFPPTSRLRALTDTPFGPGDQNAELVRIENISGDAIISGKVFLDTNGNGVIDPSLESGMRDLDVYLDTNNNGTRDDGEPMMRTDIDGDYDFRVAPGQYTVRIMDVTDFDVTSQDRQDITLGIGRTGRDLNFGIRYAGTDWTNPLNELDVDAVNGVTTRDALLVINELTLRQFSDASAMGALPALTSVPLNPIFLDVNADGFVAPQDAIFVINGLPSPTPALNLSVDADTDRLPAIRPLTPVELAGQPSDDAEERLSAIDEVFAAQF